LALSLQSSSAWKGPTPAGGALRPVGGGFGHGLVQVRLRDEIGQAAAVGARTDDGVALPVEADARCAVPLRVFQQDRHRRARGEQDRRADVAGRGLHGAGVVPVIQDLGPVDPEANAVVLAGEEGEILRRGADGAGDGEGSFPAGVEELIVRQACALQAEVCAGECVVERAAAERVAICARAGGDEIDFGIDAVSDRGGIEHRVLVITEIVGRFEVRALQAFARQQPALLEHLDGAGERLAQPVHPRTSTRAPLVVHGNNRPGTSHRHSRNVRPAHHSLRNVKCRAAGGNW
jgi:hypothetical protein